MWRNESSVRCDFCREGILLRVSTFGRGNAGAPGVDWLTFG